jgi:hypothetical protein
MSFLVIGDGALSKTMIEELPMIADVQWRLT